MDMLSMAQPYWDSSTAGTIKGQRQQGLRQHNLLLAGDGRSPCAGGGGGRPLAPVAVNALLRPAGCRFVVTREQAQRSAPLPLSAAAAAGRRWNRHRPPQLLQPLPPARTLCHPRPHSHLDAGTRTCKQRIALMGPQLWSVVLTKTKAHHGENSDNCPLGSKRTLVACQGGCRCAAAR